MRATFKVWVPTAKGVSVKLYTSGNYGADDLIKMVPMTMTEKGVWTATVSGNLNGVYYNYDVSFSTYTVEARTPIPTPPAPMVTGAWSWICPPQTRRIGKTTSAPTRA